MTSNQEKLAIASELMFLVDAGFTVEIQELDLEYNQYSVKVTKNELVSGEVGRTLSETLKAQRVWYTHLQREANREGVGFPGDWRGEYDIQMRGRDGWIRIHIIRTIYNGSGTPMLLDLHDGSSINFDNVTYIRKGL